jgi:hypothetical protein
LQPLEEQSDKHDDGDDDDGDGDDDDDDDDDDGDEMTLNKIFVHKMR